jgi:hypothetical protein
MASAPPGQSTFGSPAGILPSWAALAKEAAPEPVQLDMVAAEPVLDPLLAPSIHTLSCEIDF